MAHMLFIPETSSLLQAFPPGGTRGHQDKKVDKRYRPKVAAGEMTEKPLPLMNFLANAATSPAVQRTLTPYPADTLSKP